MGDARAAPWQSAAPDPRASRVWSVVVSGAPVVLALVVLATTVVSSRRGLGFSDESFMLRIIAAPESSEPGGEVFLAGFLLSPVYDLVGGDVWLFRLLGLLAMAALAHALSVEGLALARRAGFDRPVSSAAASLTVVASSTLVFSLETRVLGYRALAIMGAAVMVLGAARAVRPSRAAPWSAAWAGGLVGVGSALALVGKPTAGAATTAFVVAFLVLRRRVSTALVVGGVAGGGVVLLVTLFLAGMTPADAVGFLSRGVHQNALLGGHSFWRMLGISPPEAKALLVLGPLLVAPLVVGSVVRRVRPKEVRGPALDGMVMVALAVMGVLLAHVAARALGPRNFEGQILSVALVVPLLVAWLVGRRWRSAAARRGSADVTAFVCLLLALPYATAVGSNVIFLWQMPLAMVFWVLALVVVVTVHRPSLPLHPHVYLVTATCVVACIGWVLHVGGPAGPDLRRATTSAPVSGGELLLKPEDAAVARELRRVRDEHRITDRTPVVDVTGVGAGYAYLLGGRFLGRAHFYGYLDGGRDSAAWALAQEACADRAAAWLVYSPSSDYDVSDAVRAQGVLVPEDYDEVTRFRSSQGDLTMDVQVLRPTRRVAEKLGCPGPPGSPAG